MNTQKFEKVIGLSAKERYGYLIRRAADFEQVFSIADEFGELVTLSDEELESIPVWPEPEFAEAFIIDEWKGFNIKKIDLDRFYMLLESLEKDGTYVSGFPNKELNAVVVQPSEIKSHLIFECQQYE